MVPELFRPLKQIVDQQRSSKTPTRFLLTGSINIMSLPALSDALVGRMAVVTLYPFSVSEIKREKRFDINSFFEESVLFKQDGFDADNIEDLIHKATFPEISLDSKIDRYAWFEGYLTTLLHHDIRAISDIEKGIEIPKMLRLLAVRAGNLINDSSVATDLGLSLMTYRRYRALLQHVFLITMIHPWFNNMGKRLIKSPKLYFIDTSLLCHALGMDLKELKKSQNPVYGHVMENFVATELLKIIDSQPFRLYHFRTQRQEEVDFVLERSDGKIIGLEVKTKSQITSKDLKGLKALKSHAGTSFCKGIVLHSGNLSYALGDNFYAVPLAALWNESFKA